MSIVSTLINSHSANIIKLSMCLCASVSAPITVTVTPPMGSMIIIAGSSPNLTCTVELSPLVDLKVKLTTVWTGPAGFMTTNTAQPVMGSTTTYTSTAMISSIGREQSGNYTCTVTVRIMSSFFTDIVGYSSSRIIVGKIADHKMHTILLCKMCAYITRYVLILLILY